MSVSNVSMCLKVIQKRPLKHEIEEHTFMELGKLYSKMILQGANEWQVIYMCKSLVKLNVLVRLNWYGKLLCTKILDGKYMWPLTISHILTKFNHRVVTQVAVKVWLWEFYLGTGDYLHKATRKAIAIADGFITFWLNLLFYNTCIHNMYVHAL